MKPLIIIPVIDNYVTWTGTLESWKFWCDKHDIILHVQTKPVTTERIEMWTDKWDAIKIIEDLYPGTTHVGMVDADIIIRWDCPNVFDYITDDNKVYAALDSGTHSGLNYMLDIWKPLFPDSTASADQYINAGLLFMSIDLLRNITREIWNAYDNRERVEYQYNRKDEQTPLNHIIYNNLTLLPKQLNDMIMFNYDDYSFINQSYIWHFTGPRMNGYTHKKEIIDLCWSMIEKYYIKH